MVRRTSTGQSTKGLNQEINLVRKDLETLRKEIKERFDKMMNLIVELMGKFETWEQENEIGSHDMRNVRDQIEDHERRINKLEKAN